MNDFKSRKAIPLEECEAIAAFFRKKFQMERELVPDVALIFSDWLPLLPATASLKLVGRPDHRMDGDAYCRSESHRIYVKESIRLAALALDGFARFILLHELFHYLHHKGAYKKHYRIGVDRSVVWISDVYSMETQADNFALAFLMPNWIVKTVANVAELARTCSVPLFLAHRRFEQYQLRFATRTVPLIPVEAASASRLKLPSGPQVGTVPTRVPSLHLDLGTESELDGAMRTCPSCGRRGLMPGGGKVHCPKCRYTSGDSEHIE